MTAACPACAALPDPARAATAAPDLVLHLPDIHCAVCIASVEDALNAVPGLGEARVNLTLKRAFVASGGVSPDTLIDALARAGHRAQIFDPGLLGGQDRSGRDLLMRVGVAGFAMMNVMLLSVAVWSGADHSTALLFHLISALIAVPAVAYSARPFFGSALGALSAGRLNMDVPISVAILLALLASLAGALLGHDRAAWFDAALALTFFLLVGRYLDHMGRSSARSAAAELAALEAPQAVRVVDGREEIVRATDIQPGDLIRVRPGDRLPVDGVILEGETDLDRAALTGESQPDAVGVGDAVAAGEVTLTGPLLVRTLRAGADTSLRRLADLVAAAEMQKSRYAGIADRAARVYAPLVHILGAASFIAWFYATADGWRALDVAISVLVITCPCALGLAVPAVSTVTTARLFRKGMLVKSRTALERLAEIDMVVFDKTGTLTTGRMTLTSDLSEADLMLAAGLAEGSSHPVSRALAAAAMRRGVTPAKLSDLREIPGHGVTATTEAGPVRLGRADWVGATEGATALRRADGSVLPLAFSEELRADATDTVAAIRDAGYEVTLLSGDAPDAVARMARTLGIETALPRMSPEAKAAWLSAAKEAGRKPLMVGDGLNDTGGLAVAHASIAPSSALDAARNAADLVLLSDHLAPVAEALRAAKVAKARMKQNIAQAVLYNVVSVPVALAGFATPLLAAIAMSTSSVTVSLNAVRGQK
ncbi:Cu2+-exporting ATPase [Roseivivax lentus]|uniref:Cu2+-exporting ATPase n=1 Tax=Roseivivax lentus TaxID=633194 RepID=A0A1N7MQZ9_9RHOB|nr:heavy metal translocating P-type ATPase [Roseivivax lentus]SIS88492.1 Cu2+-exporting ATPase [Roseivivax lentus]